MPKQIIKFQCEHCNKKAYASKYKTLIHEGKCFYNSANKSCITCQNLTDDEDGAYCETTMKAVMVRGSPISSCARWEQKEEDEGDECE